LVDCIDIKVDEGVPVREVRNIESTTKDIVEVEYEQVQELEKKTLSQIKMQIIRKTQINRQHQILPP
jgi:hypothetical protein